MSHRVLGAVAAILCFLAIHSPAAAGGHQDAETYDYIVVGSGPGGAPVASNLAKAGHSVLLLEAGDDQSLDISTQILSIGFPQVTNRWDFYVKLYSNDTQALRNNHLTWKRADGSLWVGNGSSAPADATLLGVYYPRGATLGGSSVINAAATMLPSEGYWDSIGALTGDRTWSSDALRQIFKRIERNHYLRVGTPGHGFNGYLDTNGNNGTIYVDNPGLTEVLKSMVSSLGADPAQTLSFVTRDINDNSPVRDNAQGLFGLPYHATEFWRRFSARDVVLATLNATRADGSRKYLLTLRVNSLVTRILLDKHAAKRPRAIGVEYLQGKSMYSGDPRYDPATAGTLRRAMATKEVIISGGVFNTPQLLQLSGIGPKKDLAKLNISAVVDLPGVGRRLQDNPELPVVGVAKKPFESIPEPGDPICTLGSPGDPCVEAWLQGRGPYARAAFNTNAFMLKSNHSSNGEVDLLVFAIPYAFRGYWRFDAFVNMPADPPGTFGLSMVKMYPQNRAGVVKLRSSNPRDMPDINFNYFQENGQNDLRAMSDAVAWGRSVYGNVSNSYGPITPTEPPLCAAAGGLASCASSDEQWIRDQAFGHHASGTCAIGANNDDLSVLDSKFRVRGVDSLRVVDGSVFPAPPGAFPVISTFLISEKASKDILNDA